MQLTLPAVLEFIEYFEQISVIYQSGITSQGERSSNRTEGDWLWQNISYILLLQKLGLYIYIKHTNAAQKYNL